MFIGNLIEIRYKDEKQNWRDGLHILTGIYGHTIRAIRVNDPGNSSNDYHDIDDINISESGTDRGLIEDVLLSLKVIIKGNYSADHLARINSRIRQIEELLTRPLYNVLSFRAGDYFVDEDGEIYTIRAIFPGYIILNNGRSYETTNVEPRHFLVAKEF